MCMEATAEMAAAFPELVIVCGHTVLVGVAGSEPGDDGRRAHAWCVDPLGAIIDPTASQWAATPIIAYEPAPDDAYGDRRCAECGARYFLTSVWEDTTVCSEQCGRSYAAYVTEGAA